MAQKLKTLRPSLREKKRYMVFEVHTKQPVSESEVSEAIWKGALGFFGEFGLSKAGISILHDRWDQKSQRGILRTSHTEVDLVKAAMLLIKEVGKEQAIISTIGVSGILDKAFKGFLAKQSQ